MVYYRGTRDIALCSVQGILQGVKEIQETAGYITGRTGDIGECRIYYRWYRR